MFHAWRIEPAAGRLRIGISNLNTDEDFPAFTHRFGFGLGLGRPLFTDFFEVTRANSSSASSAA